MWLVAKFSPQLSGLGLDGRTWERTVASLLCRPGFTRRQGPGNHSLFGLLSASGVQHEIDGAADGWRGSVIVECKATEGGISKADAALFNFKVMDFYQKKIAVVSQDKWWPILVRNNADRARGARRGNKPWTVDLRPRPPAPACAHSRGRSTRGGFAPAGTAATGNCPPRGARASPPAGPMAIQRALRAGNLSAEPLERLRDQGSPMA